MNKLQAISSSRGFCCIFSFLSYLRDEGKWKVSDLRNEFPGVANRTLREAKFNVRNGLWGCQGVLDCVKCKTPPIPRTTDLSGTTLQLSPSGLEFFSQEAILERGRAEREAALLRSAEGRMKLSQDHDPEPQS